MSPESATSPVFVVGTPRSGTTLTAAILGRHPDLLMPGELHFFEDIYARRGATSSLSSPEVRARVVERLLSIYGRYNQPDQDRIERLFACPETRARLDGAATDYGSLLSTFMDIQLRQSGKTRWGNNTPKDVFHVDSIDALFPQAKFVICVRDPRDFLLSYKGRWQVSEHGTRLRSLYHPILTSLLWKATVQRIPSIEDRLGPTRCSVVHYEALVNDTAATVRRLCNVLDLSYCEAMLEVQSHNSSAPTSDTGIFNTSVGRWRDGLEPEEVFLAERIAGPGMELLGYERSGPQANPLRLAGHVATLPARTIAALWANRSHRGPTLPYLRRRFQALLR